MPSDTSVSIEDVPCLAFFSAARWNGHAHHSATGAAHAISSHCQPGEPQRRDQRQHQRQVGERDEEDQRHDQPAAQVGERPVAPRSPGRPSALRPSSALPRSPRAVAAVARLLDRRRERLHGQAAGAVTRAVAVA